MSLRFKKRTVSSSLKKGPYCATGDCWQHSDLGQPHIAHPDGTGIRVDFKKDLSGGGSVLLAPSFDTPGLARASFFPLPSLSFLSLSFSYSVFLFSPSSCLRGNMLMHTACWIYERYNTFCQLVWRSVLWAWRDE